jgi:hypothetical protein
MYQVIDEKYFVRYKYALGYTNEWHLLDMYTFVYFFPTTSSYVSIHILYLHMLVIG